MIAAALKAKWMELRKAKDPQAAFLGLIQSDAQGLAKKQNSDNPVVSDDNALQAIRAGIKKGEDTLRLITEKGGKPDPAVQAEVSLLTQLLPPQASEEDVRAAVAGHIKARECSGEAKSMKWMGPVLKELETQFGAALDKAKASQIIKAALSA
jgi:uncharacterized protein YqeY